MTKKEKILIPPKSYASIGVYLFYVYFNNSVINAIRSVKYKKKLITYLFVWDILLFQYVLVELPHPRQWNLESIMIKWLLFSENVEREL